MFKPDYLNAPLLDQTSLDEVSTPNLTTAEGINGDLSKSVNKSHVALGETVIYTIQFTNTTDLQFRVVLTDTLPASLVLKDQPNASVGTAVLQNNFVKWSERLDAKSGVTITYTAEPIFSVPVGTKIVNTVVADMVQPGEMLTATSTITVQAKIFLPLISKPLTPLPEFTNAGFELGSIGWGEDSSNF